MLLMMLMMMVMNCAWYMVDVFIDAKPICRDYEPHPCSCQPPAGDELGCGDLCLNRLDVLFYFTGQSLTYRTDMHMHNSIACLPLAVLAMRVGRTTNNIFPFIFVVSHFLLVLLMIVQSTILYCSFVSSWSLMYLVLFSFPGISLFSMYDKWLCCHLSVVSIC